MGRHVGEPEVLQLWPHRSPVQVLGTGWTRAPTSSRASLAVAGDSLEVSL